MHGDDIYRVETSADGPVRSLPLTPELLRDRPSGDMFGLTQNAGMGWDAAELGPRRVPDPLARRAASAPTTARRSRSAITPATGRSACSYAGGRRGARPRSAALPFAAYVSDPCDGRTPGHDRHVRHRCRTATTRRSSSAGSSARCRRARGVIGVATCDKGLPAMMMALAAFARPRRACSCPAASRCRRAGGEDAGAVQTLGARFAHGHRHARGGGRARLPRLRAAPAAAASSSAPRRPRRSSPRRSG